MRTKFRCILVFVTLLLFISCENISNVSTQQSLDGKYWLCGEEIYDTTGTLAEANNFIKAWDSDRIVISGTSIFYSYVYEVDNNIYTDTFSLKGNLIYYTDPSELLGYFFTEKDTLMWWEDGGDPDALDVEVYKFLRE